MYYVRIKVEDAENGVTEYHAALDLAVKVSGQYPGLLVEVEQDKVWASFCTKEG